MTVHKLYFVPLSSLSGKMAEPHNHDTARLSVLGTDFGITGPATEIEIRDTTSSTLPNSIINDKHFNDDNAFDTQILTKAIGDNPAGSGVELNYSYTATGSDGSQVTVYSVAMHTDTSLLGAAQDKIVGYVSTAPLKPGVTYTVTRLDSTVDPPYSSLVPCFTSGTLIETARGARPVEYLARGEMVQTADNGLRPIRWIGARHLGAMALSAMPNLRPVRIAAGALGAGMPEHDLIVSPQHRVLVRSAIARRMFGAPEVLVAAKQLMALDGIETASDLKEVTYHHFLFDRHEIVFSNGAATESLYTGAQALKSVGPEAACEIFALFPELRSGTSPPGARILVPGRLARKLAQRHAKNARDLVA